MKRVEDRMVDWKGLPLLFAKAFTRGCWSRQGMQRTYCGNSTMVSLGFLQGVDLSIGFRGHGVCDFLFILRTARRMEFMLGDWSSRWFWHIWFGLLYNQPTQGTSTDRSRPWEIALYLEPQNRIQSWENTQTVHNDWWFVELSTARSTNSVTKGGGLAGHEGQAMRWKVTSYNQ